MSEISKIKYPDIRLILNKAKHRKEQERNVTSPSIAIVPTNTTLVLFKYYQTIPIQRAITRQQSLE